MSEGFFKPRGSEGFLEWANPPFSGTPALTAAIGLLGAVVAWADGSIGTTAPLAAVWAAAQACFIRAGIANEVKRSQE